jgi:hypothetical protein
VRHTLNNDVHTQLSLRASLHTLIQTYDLLSSSDVESLSAHHLTQLAIVYSRAFSQPVARLVA